MGPHGRSKSSPPAHTRKLHKAAPPATREQQGVGKPWPRATRLGDGLAMPQDNIGEVHDAAGRARHAPGRSQRVAKRQREGLALGRERSGVGHTRRLNHAQCPLGAVGGRER